jgi:GH24 family phage-related lysozyme (muramidase)
MTTPDKMFTLDPIKTDVTQPLQHLKAHQDSDTSVADAQFSKGLSAFGNAVGSLAERKKQERIDSDIALAKEAAIRNEVMPGGLLPIAVDAFEKTQDIHTANQAYADIEVFYEGEEVQTITNNSLLTPVQKNSQISTAIDNLFRTASSSVRDADVLLALKNKVDGLKVNSMRDVWNIDKSQRYGVAINTVNSQVDNAFDSGEDINDIFTDKWIKTVSRQLRDGLPWVSKDDAKLTVFSTLANNEAMVDHPDLITKLMQAEFSKGVTFAALSNASRTEAGQHISQIYTRFLEKSERHFADIRREEREDEADRNKIVTEKGIAFLDSMTDKSNPAYPDRFKALRKIMVEDGGGNIGTYNKLVRIYSSLEEFSKNTRHSKQFVDGKFDIAKNKIKNLPELLDYADLHSLDTEAISVLTSFLSEDHRQYRENVELLRGRTSTVNNSLTSALSKKLTPSSGMLSILENASADELVDSKIDLRELFGRVSIDPDVFVDGMIALAGEREQLRIDIDAESRASIAEGRPLNADELVKGFHDSAKLFIQQLGEASKVEVEVEKVEKVEVKKEVTPPINKDEVTTEEKKDVINIAKMHDSEKPAAHLINGIVKGLEVVRSVPEKAGKFLGEGMVKTFFALKEDIAAVTTSDIKIEAVEKVLKNGGEIPKDVKEVLIKESSVLDTLLNFFSNTVSTVTTQGSKAEGSDKLSETPKVFPDSDLMKEAKVKGQEALFTQESYRKILEKTYPEDPRFTQEEYQKTLEPLTSLKALSESVSKKDKEDTTGFKMPDSFEEEAKAREDATVDSLKFTSEDGTTIKKTALSNIEDDTEALASDRIKAGRGSLTKDIKNKVTQINTLGNSEDKYEDIISIVEATPTNDNIFKRQNDGKFTATNGMTASLINTYMKKSNYAGFKGSPQGTPSSKKPYTLGDKLDPQDYKKAFGIYKKEILKIIKTFEPEVGFSKNHRLALFMIIYNSGGGIVAPEGIKALKAGDFERASHELFSKKAGLTKGKDSNGKLRNVDGLVKRRIIERTIFETQGDLQLLKDI